MAKGGEALLQPLQSARRAKGAAAMLVQRGHAAQAHLIAQPQPAQPFPAGGAQAILPAGPAGIAAQQA